MKCSICKTDKYISYDVSQSNFEGGIKRMNSLKMLEGIHKDTVYILENSTIQTIGMNITSYTRHLNELCRFNAWTYAEIINNEPLTAWVISTMMPEVNIRPLIRFSREFMLNNIELYAPYLSKWLDYIIVVCEDMANWYFDGITNADMVYLDSLNLPYYMKNRIADAPEQGIYRYVFEDISNALARNDYASYIDMCLEVTRCIEISSTESKEVI